MIAQAEGLKHARQSVAEVDEQQRLGDEVEQRHPPDLKAQHHHRVHIRHGLAVQDGLELGEIAHAVDARTGSTVKCAR